jgi:hypothetical protein
VISQLQPSRSPTSPLYERMAVALSGSEEALGALAGAPTRKRHPRVILAALHDLTLAGRAPALAAAMPLPTATLPRQRRSTRGWQ